MTFDVFSPKIITSRYPFKDIALESRIISILMRQTKRKDIVIMLDESFWEQAHTIRNFLLMYRFKNLNIPQTKIDEVQWQSIEPIVRQTLIPLFSTIRTESVKDEFVAFAKEYQESVNIDRGLESDSVIAEKLVDLLENNDIVTVKDVTEQVNLGMDEKEKLSSKAVGKKIRRFGFKPKKVQGVYRVNFDQSLVEMLIERYNLSNKESPQSQQNTNSESTESVDKVDKVDINKE